MQWEYRIEVLGYNVAGVIESKLNKLGIRGWELVQADEGRYIFKRRLK